MEAKTTLARRQDAVQGDFMRKMLTNAGCLLCGILVSRGAVLGSLAPFGASFAAAVPRKYLLSSLLGTAFGYVLLKPSDSFRYLAVVAAIGGLRWLLGDLDKVTKSKVFAPLVAFVPIFATGVSLLFVSTSTLTTFADCVTEVRRHILSAQHCTLQATTEVLKFFRNRKPQAWLCRGVS